MKTLATSLDWANIETELHRLGDTLPLFRSDVTRFIKAIREDVTELSKLEVEYRRTHSSRSKAECASKVTKINEQLKIVHKFHLMSLLAQ